jgi:hypothetical protein
MSDNATHIPTATTAEAWLQLGARWEDERLLVPERDSDGCVLGWVRVEGDDSSRTDAGNPTGVFTVWPLPPYAGTSLDVPIYIVDGPADVAAGLGVGLDVIGVHGFDPPLTHSSA